MSKLLKAKDVQNLLLFNEEGESSSDESDDFCEEQDYPDDKTLCYLQEQLLPTNYVDDDDDDYNNTTNSNSSLDDESQISLKDFDSTNNYSSNIDVLTTSQSLMSFASINNQEDSSTMNISVESLAQNKSTTIATETFFKKPLPLQKSTRASIISSSHINKKHNSSSKKNIGSVAKKAIDKKNLNNSEKYFYGKMTKAMEKNGTKPYSWSKEPMPDSFVPLEQYNSIPSLTNKCENLVKISDFFNFIFNDEILEIIIKSTNQKIQTFSLNKEYARENILQPVTKIELRSFIGILLLLGFLKKGHVDVNKIWSNESLHFCYMASATMSRDRFRILSVCITFDDLDTREERKQFDRKFYKMKSVFDLFRENVKKLIVPGRDLCIDETL